MDFPISESEAVSFLENTCNIPASSIEVAHPSELSNLPQKDVAILPSYSDWLKIKDIVTAVGDRHFYILGCKFYESLLEMCSHRVIKTIPVKKGNDRKECEGCYNEETCKYAHDTANRNAPDVVWFSATN